MGTAKAPPLRRAEMDSGNPITVHPIVMLLYVQ